jgi:uncharacterized protein YndB with AHSA1/START domain
MTHDIHLEFVLSCKPKRAMQLLTDPVLIRKWSGGEAVVENVIGGRFEMFDGWVHGKILKLAPHELAYTWKASDWPEEAQPSEVHYLLKDDEAGTRVIVDHNGLPSEDEMKSHKSGWSDYFFDPLEDYILILDKS